MYRLLSTTAEPSFWEALWAVESRTYDNLGITTDRGIITLRGIILGLCAGLILAAAWAMFDKRRLGGLVRRIIREQALSPENAKTLPELGYKRNLTLRNSLKNGVLSKTVRCVERDEYMARYAALEEEQGDSKKSKRDPLPPFAIDWANHHFYIPDDKHYAAEVRFNGKGSGWLAFIVVVVIAVIIAVAACFFLPDILQVLDNFAGSFSSKSNIA